MNTETTYTRLTHPAPARCSVELKGGRYSTTQWTLKDVWLYRRYGGWFASGHHDFDCNLTTRVALCSNVNELPDSIILKVAEALVEV